MVVIIIVGNRNLGCCVLWTQGDDNVPREPLHELVVPLRVLTRNQLCDRRANIQRKLLSRAVPWALFEALLHLHFPVLFQTWKPGSKRHQSSIERNYNVMELINTRERDVFVKQTKWKVSFKNYKSSKWKLLEEKKSHFTQCHRIRTSLLRIDWAAFGASTHKQCKTDYRF